MGKPDHPYFELPNLKSRDYIAYRGFNPEFAKATVNLDWLGREAAAGRDQEFWVQRIRASASSYRPYQIENLVSSFSKRVLVPESLTGSTEDIEAATTFGILASAFEFRSGQYKPEKAHPVIWNALCGYPHSALTIDVPGADYWAAFAAYTVLRPERALQ